MRFPRSNMEKASISRLSLQSKPPNWVLTIDNGISIVFFFQKSHHLTSLKVFIDMGESFVHVSTNLREFSFTTTLRVAFTAQSEPEKNTLSLRASGLKAVGVCLHWLT